MSSPPVLLVHGGLAEDIGAERFWERPGIAPGLRAAGFVVVAPDRPTTPTSWSAAASDVAAHVREPSSVVAGSNGVTVAVRLALEHPSVVDRLVLLWPATAGDVELDARVPEPGRHLLAGETLRGVTDHELRGLAVPAAVMAADPPNAFHALATAERVVELVPRGSRIPADFPESPRPEFARRCADFVAALVPYLR
jgi:pimeloyl-ACP methyl ester carboxylesterase